MLTLPEALTNAHEYAPYAWLIAGLILTLAETSTPGLFFFLAFAVGSCGSAATAFLGFGFFVQCMSMLITSTASFILLRMYALHNHLSPVDYHRTPTNIHALMGRKALVIESLPAQGNGRIRVGSEEWSATNRGTEPLAKGDSATVIGYQGNRLIVNK
jgi:membrane protein implicated in regulation of membrane protease activity